MKNKKFDIVTSQFGKILQTEMYDEDTKTLYGTDCTGFSYIKKYDENGREIYYKDSTGYEKTRETFKINYDAAIDQLLKTNIEKDNTLDKLNEIADYIINTPSSTNGILHENVMNSMFKAATNVKYINCTADINLIDINLCKGDIIIDSFNDIYVYDGNSPIFIDSYINLLYNDR